MAGQTPEARWFGREDALRYLDDAPARLLTVLGPPGIGKSRLCREWVRGRGEDAVLVEVGGARTLDEVRESVARALSVDAHAGKPIGDEELTRALAARGAFALVLDDVQRIDALDDAVRAWLSGVTELRVIMTSRRRLGLTGETLFSLPPLEVPSGPEFPPKSAGLVLFIDRARRARPDLDLQPESITVMSRLVALLDGLPLAIELCAARVRLLSLSELIHRIQSRSKPRLTATDKTAEPRDSLEAAIVASFEMLEPNAQRDLARLSAFVGGFDLSAAEAALEVDPNRAMEIVETFLDQSLLSPEASLLPSDPPRFRLLGPIREAALTLAPDERREALERCMQYFARAGVGLGQRVVYGDPEALRLLSLDRENLIAAHHHAVDAAHASRAMRTALALGILLWSEGPLSACLEYLNQAIRIASRGSIPEPLLALAHGGRALTLLSLGRLDEAVVARRGAAKLAEGIADEVLKASVTRQIAKVLLAEGAWEETKAALERSLALSTSMADRHGVAQTRLALGELAYYRDDLAGALSHYEAARAIMSAQGLAHGLALANDHVGQIQTELGRNVEARASLEEALAGFERNRDRRNRTHTLMFLGILSQAEGRLEEALTAFDLALSAARISDFRRGEGNALGFRAGCLLEAGQDREAIREYTRAIDNLRESGLSPGAFFYGGLAVALARCGDFVGAEAALASARHPRERIDEQPFAERTVALHAAHVAWLAVDPRNSSEEECANARRVAERVVASGGPTQSDVRFAERLLTHALAATASSGGVTASAPAVAHDLTIARSGRWFETAEVGRVDLQRRRALRKCLCEFARMRTENPGVALSVHETVAIGWPGERIHPEAARERVYTAITTLRRFGLRTLIRRDDGYLIDPAQAVRLVDDGP